MTRRTWDETPAAFDGRIDAMQMMMVQGTDVVLSIDTDQTPDLLAHIPPDRLQAQAKANSWFPAYVQQRGVRSVSIGNEMNPADYRATRYGVPKAELERVFWSGVGVDGAELQAQGAAVQAQLAKGRELRITHPNGTDLRMTIAGRRVGISDGVISEDDVRAGGGATSTWLPAGEVYVAPVRGTAKGRLVVDRTWIAGKPVEKISYSIDKGKVTRVSGGTHYAEFKKRYDAAGDGKDEFGFVDIGINPQVRALGNGAMTPWVATGMVTVGMGQNLWTGGENNSAYGMVHHLPGATITVDGVPLVERGELKTAAR